MEEQVRNLEGRLETRIQKQEIFNQQQESFNQRQDEYMMKLMQSIGELKDQRNGEQRTSSPRSFSDSGSHFLPDSYVLDTFIAGLKPTVKPFVKAFKPKTIFDAVEYARYQEETLKANAFKNSVQGFVAPKTTHNVPLLSNVSAKPPILLNPQNKNSQNTLIRPNTRNYKHIPADVREEKIAKMLRYYCDQHYERGHKCQHLFTVEFLGEESEDDSEDDRVTELEMQMADPHLSVNALSGNQNFHTMRVLRMVGSKPLHILIDSGSTCNFLDLNLAEMLGCPIEKIASPVTVADGSHIACWMMNKHTAMLISLGGCDMLLRVQWLTTLGQIDWDFKKLLMTFALGKKQFTLKGVPPQKLEVVEGEVSCKILESAAQLCFLQVVSISEQNSVGFMTLEYEEENLVPGKLTTKSPISSSLQHADTTVTNQRKRKGLVSSQKQAWEKPNDSKPKKKRRGKVKVNISIEEPKEDEGPNQDNIRLKYYQSLDSNRPESTSIIEREQIPTKEAYLYELERGRIQFEEFVHMPVEQRRPADYENPCFGYNLSMWSGTDEIFLENN